MGISGVRVRRWPFRRSPRRTVDLRRPLLGTRDPIDSSFRVSAAQQATSTESTQPPRRCDRVRLKSQLQKSGSRRSVLLAIRAGKPRWLPTNKGLARCDQRTRNEIWADEFGDRIVGLRLSINSERTADAYTR